MSLRATLPLLPLFASIAIHAAVVGGLVARSRALTLEAQDAAVVAVAVVGSPHVTQPSIHPAGLAHATVPASPDEEAVSTATSRATTTDPATSIHSSGPSTSAVDSYASQVRARIERNLRYPIALRRRGVEGKVDLVLALDPQARTGTPELAQGSGSAELDALALDAARASEPYPAPSDELKKMGKLVLSLPIEFKLQR